MKTPTGKQQQIDEATAEKTSGKKLIQPRLPFKIIMSELTSPSSAPTTTLVKPTEESNLDNQHTKLFVTQDARKRRLSYEGNCKSTVLSSPYSKKNLAAASTKKTKTDTTMEGGIIMLDDSEDESLKLGAVIKKSEDCASSPSTSPQNTNNRKGAGTPKNTVASENLVRKGNTPKLQIKLPLSNKKRRKKSSQGNSSVIEDVKSTFETATESSDDIEMIAEEFNPQKRQRIAETKKDQFHGAIKEGCNNSMNLLFAAEEENKNKLERQKINLNVKPETQKNRDKKSDVIITINSESEDSNSVTISTKNLKTAAKNPNGTNKPWDGNVFDGKLKKTERTNISTLLAMDISNVEASEEAGEDDEDVVESSASSVVEEINSELADKSFEENSERTVSKAAEQGKSFNKMGLPSKQQSVGITPKQKRLLEQRRMAREEKERKLQEEKLQKQREREEKELARKLEREEKEQKRREREEKEEVKRKEREERERKRLADIETKNEERRKRIEVKEEERKRKEQEKEEAEIKKKKAAEAFTKFFVSKTTRLGVAAEACQLNTTTSGVEGGGAQSEPLAFRPFQIKGDMELAPLCRKVFTDVDRENLDCFVCEKKQNSLEKTLPRSHLYLSELKAGRIVPGKWRRPTCDTKEEDDDVVVVEDALECAAQTIVEERSRSVQRFRVKFYKFHENRRPPYFGTWRKKTGVITPRRPLALDKNFFDYEVDSDLEWEEEEPGESLDGSDDEKEKESEDDDYEVDNEWFVPHGHLSDEELQNEDEGGDDNTREAQKAKLKIIQQEFAQEMKKKTEKIKPRLVGCIWQDYNGSQPKSCPNIIWESLNLRAMLYTSAPLLEEPSGEPTNEGLEPNSPTSNNAGVAPAEKLKRILLTDTMVKDLVRLVHGNRHSKAFLINEFIAYIEQTEDEVKNGDLRGPLKSVVRDKIDEFALWRIVESNNNTKSKKNKKKLCWLVAEDKLKEYDLQDLELHNKWTYTLRPKFVETHDQSAKQTSVTECLAEGPGRATSETSPLGSQKAITKFTKVLTAAEKEKQSLQNADDSKNDTAVQATSTKNLSSDNNAAPSCTQTPKSTVKKRVPLLISTPRGQQISTPAKNALISQYLKKNKDAAEKSPSSTAEVASVGDDEVVVMHD